MLRPCSVRAQKKRRGIARKRRAGRSGEKRGEEVQKQEQKQEQKQGQEADKGREWGGNGTGMGLSDCRRTKGVGGLLCRFSGRSGKIRQIRPVPARPYLLLPALPALLSALPGLFPVCWVPILCLICKMRRKYPSFCTFSWVCPCKKRRDCVQ